MQKFMNIITFLTTIFLRRWALSMANTFISISRARNIHRHKLFSPASIVVSVLLALTAVSAHSQNLRIMPMGDSITEGIGVPNGNSYRAPLYDQLINEVSQLDYVGNSRDGNFSDLENEGHSGWRIDQIASIATGVVVQYRPNLVLLHIGTNDINGNFQVDTAPARLAALIDQIFAAAPNSTILVAAIIRAGSDSTTARMATFNNQTRFTVESRANQGKHIALVDMGSVTVADLADGLHPNENGYRKMADAWHGAIKQVIAKGWIGEPDSMGPANGSYVLHPAHAQGQALDDYAGDLRDNSPIDIWQTNNTAAQSWTISNANVAPSGYYNIALSLGNYCLTASGTNRGAAVTLLPCNGSKSQAWRATPKNGGYTWNPANNNGLCLDVNGWGTTNGTGVGVWTCSAGDNQRWILNRTGSGGFTKQIEAESYTSMVGVLTEATSDAGGGQNVGWIDVNDFMVYANTNFPSSGSYKVEYRVASPGGATLSLDLNAGSIQLGQVTIPATGGWQSWVTVSNTVNINAGTYSLGIFAPKGGWNINWIKFTKI